VKPCVFKKDIKDPNSPLRVGFFHGFFQESTNNMFGRVFAIIHDAEDPEGKPFRFYEWQSGLFFNKLAKEKGYDLF
jgi:hypothetical protein